MRGFFYPKFAFDSMMKNKKLYIPYLLTAVLWVMMYYIMTALTTSSYVSGLQGGASLIMILNIGRPIILFFSLLFLVYTNSFLSNRRNKEYALYHILGMNKKNIGHILFWDAILTYGITMVCGLLLGTIFFKVAELGLVNIIHQEVQYHVTIDWETAITTVIGYAVIFLVILIKSLFRIRIANPVELLRSGQAGEKPPKANWFVGILGVVLLGIAYCMALTVENPLSALSRFFVAVLLVIMGTYFLFVSGSVLFCRILQKNKGYYYRANHFVSISSMMHRMKRNGAGLAFICILATMVLVMLSSTASLYFGMENAMKERYPREINLQCTQQTPETWDMQFMDKVDTFMKEECSAFDTTPENALYYQTLVTAGEMTDGVLELDVRNSTGSFGNIYQIYMISIDDYNRIMNQAETLAEDEIFVYSTRTEYKENHLSINQGKSFQVVKHLDEFWSQDGSAAMTVFPSLFVIVSDLESATTGIRDLVGINEGPMLQSAFLYSFDSGLEEEQQLALYNQLLESEDVLLDETIDYMNWESRAHARADFYGLYGGLFFIGIILSSLFLSAAVLIIYYKQIVEGYEDARRFEIMQKVGMTNKEIRKSINSQLLTVFFLPLVFAGIHLCFAFPIIKKLLLLFNLNDVSLFTQTTIISYVIFGVFYGCIYRLTSNAYYNIVSGKTVD